MLNDIHDEKEINNMTPKEKEKTKKKFMRGGKKSINDFIAVMTTNIIPLLVPIKDVNKLKADLQDDIFMSKTIEAIIPEAYLNMDNSWALLVMQLKL